MLDEVDKRFLLIKKILLDSGSDVEIVEKAYDCAKKLHSGQLRKDGLPYISHPVEVAIILAEQGFDKEVICAGLLHDVVEDCSCTITELKENFSEKVANLVDAVSAIDKGEYVLNDDEIFEDKEFLKSSMEEQTFNKLIAFGRKNPLAFCIKFADRLHNLRSIGIFPKAKQIEKVKETEQWILPLAKILNSEYFFRNIKNECFKIVNKTKDYNFFDHYNDYHKSNKKQFEYILTKLKETFSKSFLTDIIGSDVLEYKVFDDITKVIKVNDIRRISQGQLLRVANYNIFLLTNKPKNQAIKEFLDKMKSKLSMLGKVTDANIGSFTKNIYFQFQDEIKNKYNIYIMSLTEYRKQMIGTLDGQILIDEESSHNISNEFIRVKTRSGEVKYVSASSTALDFAFKVHKDIGFAFSYAIINDSKSKLPAYTKLYDGDKVEIICETEESGQLKNVAQLRWLAYVNTDFSKKILIKYFERKLINLQ